jgi:TetR/AcrR family transcriptional regulator, transcriptional repressor for nem operon
VRASVETRHALTESVRRQVRTFSESAPGSTADERRQAAVGSWAAMIGALLLARVVDDPVLSDQLMADTRAWLAVRAVRPR